MAIDYIKAPSKKSLLSLLKKAKEITPRLLRSLFDGVVFKSELQHFVANSGVDHGSLSGLSGDDHAQYLLLTAGSGRAITDKLYIYNASNPGVIMRNEGDVDAAYLYEGSDSFVLGHQKQTGDSAFDFQAVPIDGTSDGMVRLFKTDTTTGTGSGLYIYKFDGTDTIQHVLYAKGGAELCKDSGGLTVGGTTNYVEVDSSQLLSFQGTADIAAAVDQTVCLAIYVDKKERNSEWNLHGGLVSLDTAHDLGAGDLVVTCGIGKIILSIIAGADVVGDITVTGTTVDRNTGAETAADTDTITIDAVTTDGSDTDAEGNTRHSFTGAYITSKWFKGSITISSADTDVTDMDTYQVAFEQVNDNANVELTTADMTVYATNNAAWLYGYLYVLYVTGDKCNIVREGAMELPAAEVTANNAYRIRRGNLGVTFDGTTDGFWADIFPGPLNQNYWEDANVKFWFDIKQDVYGESS